MKKKWFISLLTRLQSVNDWVNTKVNEALKSLTFDLKKLDTVAQILAAQGAELDKRTVANIMIFSKVTNIPVTAFSEAKEMSAKLVATAEKYRADAEKLERQAKYLRDIASDHMASAKKLQVWSELA